MAKRRWGRLWAWLCLRKWRAWVFLGVAVVAFGAGLFLSAHPRGQPGFQAVVRLQFAGSAKNARDALGCQGPGLSGDCRKHADAFRRTLYLDFALIAGFTIALVSLCYLGTKIALTRAGGYVAGVGIGWGLGASLTNIAQDLVLLLAIHRLDHAGDGLFLAAQTLAFVKFSLLLGAGVIALWALLVTVVRLVSCSSARAVTVTPPPPRDHPSKWERSAEPTGEQTANSEPCHGAGDVLYCENRVVPDGCKLDGRKPAPLGICVSGGGVRSGTVALGALQALRDKGQLGQARYLVSVSGGGYITGAFQQVLAAGFLKIRPDPPTDEGETAPRAEPGDVYARGSVEEDYTRRHSDYLADSLRQWLAALGGLLFRFLSGLFLIALAVFTVGTLVGFFYRYTQIVHGPALVPCAPGVSSTTVTVHGTTPVPCAPGVSTTATLSAPAVSTTATLHPPSAPATVTLSGPEVTTTLSLPGVSTTATLSAPGVSTTATLSGASTTATLSAPGVSATATLSAGVSTTATVGDVDNLLAFKPRFLARCPPQPTARELRRYCNSGPAFPHPRSGVLLAIAIMGVLAIATYVFKWERPDRSGSEVLARGLVATGGLLAGVGIAFPYVVWLGAWLTWHSALTSSHNVVAGAAGTGALSFVGTLAATLWRKKKNVGRVTGFFSAFQKKTGQVLPNSMIQMMLIWISLLALLLGLALAAGWVAASGADASWWSLVPIGLLLVIGAFLDQTFLSLHPFYRRRLASAFAVRRIRRRGLLLAESYPYKELTTLSAYGARVRDETFPQVIFQAAANISGQDRTPPGRRTVPYTFSHDYIGGPQVGWVPTNQLEMVSSRVINRDLTVQGAVAISGAAFASAMGAQTRFYELFLALANARLGAWLPNPYYLWLKSRCSNDWTVPWLPGRRRLTYWAREILGLHPSTNPLLLCTDGGHYENLGLVELLRHRCRVIYCIDASGDSPPLATTLAQAITLAHEELGVTIDLADPLDLVPGRASVDPVPPQTAPGASQDPLAKLNERLSKKSVVVGEITYPEPVTYPGDHGAAPSNKGFLIVAKANLTPDTPYELLSYALEDLFFPRDSTGDQWFNGGQFDAYQALGCHIAECAVKEAIDNGIVEALENRRPNWRLQRLPPVGAAGQTSALISTVRSMAARATPATFADDDANNVLSNNLPPDLAESLISELQSAQSDLDSWAYTDACKQFSSFISQVLAHAGESLTRSQATTLITAAEQIRSVLVVRNSQDLWMKNLPGYAATS